MSALNSQLQTARSWHLKERPKNVEIWIHLNLDGSPTVPLNKIEITILCTLSPTGHNGTSE